MRAGGYCWPAADVVPPHSRAMSEAVNVAPQRGTWAASPIRPGMRTVGRHRMLSRTSINS